MAESNSYIEQQLADLKSQFNDYKKDMKEEMRELEKKADAALRSSNNLDISMNYVKDAVKDMKELLAGFVTVQNTQNDKIDDFINSDSRRNSKNTFVVSILQVAAGIVVAALGFWAKGNL
ncbi:hypothetical protein [Planococcus sp. YIM B11945]|uniref:hypothetical protein n=1 Tax=Planococcus sp. YIM B11945 TaxID=3435410 RepID=UPI003D7EF42E